MKVSRRSFLKMSAVSGLMATGISGSKMMLTAFAENTNANGAGSGEWRGSTCQGCTTWCPVQVKVVDGRAIKVRGNPHSLSHRGNVCPRAHISLQQVYDPDRIKVPMKRTNPKKGRNEDPQFIPISWDEAIDTITDKMMELRKNNETYKYALFRGRYTQLNEIIYGSMPKIFGSPNNISHSAICAEAEKFGAFYTEGYWDYRDYDLLNTKHVLLWGGDPVASNRMTPHAINVWGEVLDNAKVIAIDPRLSATASKAHEWLPVIPGEDGALALAIAHVILVEGMWYKEFVGDFIDGVNQFKTGQVVPEESFQEKYSYGVVKWWNLELKDRTPQWAEKITGIPVEQIIRVAKGFAGAAPNAISWLTPGASMQVRGAYSAMACHALNGLVGSVDNVGGTLQSSKVPLSKAPDFSAYIDEIAAKGSKNAKIDQRGTKEFPALNGGKSGGGVVTNRVADAILSEDPYEIKVAIGYWNNFVFSCSETSRWEKALEKLPFFVHITTHPAEMSMYADIVLPAAHHMYERWGMLKSKANRYGYATLNQRVIEPMWDVKIDETEVTWLIAESLAKKGYDNLFRYFKEQFADPETGKKPTNGMEFTIYATKLLTQDIWDPTRGAKGDKLKGWKEFKEKGVWNSVAYPYRGKWGNFGTETKMFEFYSETLKKALDGHATKHNTTVDDIMETCKFEARGDYSFIPHHEPALRWGDEKEYPYIFFEHRSRLNREGRSANCTWYQEFKDVDPGDERWDDVAKINPGDGAMLGIKTGDRIRLTTPVGQIECTAKLWEGIRPGTIGKCFGQGHWAYGRIAAKDFHKKVPRGGNNNEILPADYDRFSGSTARHGGVTRVRIEKI
ncbi:MAG: molybdopterin-dependent oxidoreductase [Bacillota bacterium]